MINKVESLEILKNSSSAAIKSADGDYEVLEAFEVLTGDSESLMLIAEWSTMSDDEKSFL